MASIKPFQFCEWDSMVTVTCHQSASAMHCFSIDEATTCAACYPITPRQSHTLSNPAQPFKGISAFRKEKYLNFVGLKNVLVIVSTDEKCCSIKINQSKSIGIYLVLNVITYMCSFIFDEFSHFNCKFKVKNLCENSLTRKCVFKMKHN